MFKVGKVIKFFDKTQIALIQLDGTVSVRDRVRFVFENKDLFTQVVDFIQVGHSKVESANRGEIVGIKTQEQVTEGTDIFKA